MQLIQVSVYRNTLSVKFLIFGNSLLHFYTYSLLVETSSFSNPFFHIKCAPHSLQKMKWQQIHIKCFNAFVLFQKELVEGTRKHGRQKYPGKLASLHWVTFNPLSKVLRSAACHIYHGPHTLAGSERVKDPTFKMQLRTESNQCHLLICIAKCHAATMAYDMTPN